MGPIISSRRALNKTRVVGVDLLDLQNAQTLEQMGLRSNCSKAKTIYGVSFVPEPDERYCTPLHAELETDGSAVYTHQGLRASSQCFNTSTAFRT